MLVLLLMLGAAASFVPLVITIYASEKGANVSNLTWWIMSATGIGGLLGAITLGSTWSILSEVYLFEKFNVANVYWTYLIWPAKVWLIGLVGTLFALLVPYVICQKHISEYKGLIYAIIGVLALLVSIPIGFCWETALQYFNRPEVVSAAVDPIFNLPLNYYLFELPWLNLIQTWASAVSGIIAVGGSFLLLLVSDGDDKAEKTFGMIIAAGLALFFFSIAWGNTFDAHNLMTSSEGVVQGIGYTGVNVKVGIYSIMVYVEAAFGIFAIIAGFVPAIRKWFYDNALRFIGTLCVWGVVVLTTCGVVPGLNSYFSVKPNELSKQTPYIQHTIAGTKAAFNLNAIEEKVFEVSSKPLTQDVLKQNQGTLKNARLWDHRALLKTLSQTQELRRYYLFEDVDVDRYTINGETVQLMLAARELEDSELPTDWVNKTLKYTHGYGFTANPVNEFNDNGGPRLLVKNLPLQTLASELEVEEPRIYFGEATPEDSYVIVGAKGIDEFDYPDGDSNQENRYDGQGGILLDSYWKKLVYAWSEDSTKILLSGYITDESKIIVKRNVRERLEALAPFLTFDNDGYLVIADNKMYWMWDAYTTSNNYPYSESYSSSEFGDINYIRNSVKCVVDPYNGTVDLFVFDESDPIIQVYAGLFPKLFKSKGEMPESLMAHVRYPQDLLMIQADVNDKYHMNNPTVFFNSEDEWELPKEKFHQSPIYMEPYYITAQLAGMTEPEFMLIIPPTVKNKNNMIGWLAGLSDGADYGKLVMYKFPKSQFIAGPMQLESKIDSQPNISKEITLLNANGSQILRGNLIILPLIGNHLVAFEAIYLQGDNAKMPEIKKVIAIHITPGRQEVVWADTFDKSQKVLVGSGGTTGFTIVGGNESEVPVSADEIIVFIDGQMILYKSSTGSGNYAGAAEALNLIEQALKKYKNQ